MIYREKISGKYISLKYVSEEDAEFIIKLRTNEKNNKFIHATSNDVILQKKWIVDQQEKEGDYYFLILNALERPVGLISLYNINAQTAECGRWISEGNAFENIEAAKLIHDFGFEILSLNSIYTMTAKDNIQVVNFWKRFGGNFEGYINSEPYILYKNVIQKDLYQNEINKKISKLLHIL